MSKKTKKNKRFWPVAVLLLLLAGAGLYLILSGKVKLQNGGISNNTLEKTEVSVLAGREISGVDCTDSQIIRISKTGMRAYDAKGQACWDISFSMRTPRLSVCGRYALAADYGAVDAYLVDETGASVVLTAEAPILFARVEENGYVLLACTDGGRNSLSLYDAKGTLLLRRVTYQNKDGIPVDAAVSPDGKRLAGAYVSYTGGTLCTNVAFFDLSDNGADLTDRILGNYRLDEQLADRLWFSGHKLFFVSDADFGVIDADRDCRLVWKLSPSYEISFAACAEGVLAVGLGERKAGTASEADQNFFLYDVSGREVFGGNEEVISSLSENGGIFVAGDGYSFFAVSSRGKMLWKKNFSTECQRLLPLSDRKNVAAVRLDALEFYTVKNKWEVSEK